MTYYQEFAFNGWESIREEGAKALVRHRWRHQEKMIPMPEPESLEFRQMASLFVPYGLEVAQWVIFARPPLNKQGVHSDCAAGPDARALCAVNVPVVGYEGSRMQWFAEQDMKIVRTTYGDEYPKLSRYFVPIEEDHKQLAEVTFGTSPMLVNVYLPHRVIAHVRARAIVSVRFVGNPSIDEVMETIKASKLTNRMTNQTPDFRT